MIGEFPLTGSNHIYIWEFDEGVYRNVGNVSGEFYKVVFRNGMLVGSDGNNVSVWKDGERD